ncbi:4Fe-4S binding protein [Fusibacter paucivorans]|uniref:4Fe-4S binding protein n=1 Tax=Fusibacter paucivorans TaxID=76009 RepID=A0ABS5PMV1_9FIRM|nr:4Fe-4S binding protein [Fusibacter paucivorans]MBS7526192.1 4Fe-4S binding protein [Fusibacter paucivorans]
MKKVTWLAKVNLEKCIGCGTCDKVCPVYAIEMKDRKAIIDSNLCTGCGNCEQRCPISVIELVKRDEPIYLKVDVASVDQDAMKAICLKAKFNPEQIVCYCTETRADEVAAAILKGADTPEKVSQMTGIRTGCGVECIQPILRMLDAAGIVPEKPRGWQWYGKTPTIWDIPEEIREKYNARGFYFAEDEALLDAISKIKPEGE